jgi:hypothetical protein
MSLSLSINNNNNNNLKKKNVQENPFLNEIVNKVVKSALLACREEDATMSGKQLVQQKQLSSLLSYIPLIPLDSLKMRCVEYHQVTEQGGLPDKNHFDGGLVALYLVVVC